MTALGANRLAVARLRAVPTRFSTFLVGIALIAGVTRLPAQSLAAGDSLIATGDTTAAIAAYEAAAGTTPLGAEAHYRAALLYMTRYVAGEQLSAVRGKAEAHLRAASRAQPDSAKYWLALAEVMRTSNLTTIRMQVAGLVNRAIKAARRFGSDALAAAEYRAGRISWERYEQLGHQYIFTGEANTIDDQQAMGDWKYVQRFFEQQVTPDSGHPGEADLDDAETHLRDALKADPRAVDAAGLLIVAMGEGNRWQEAYDQARALVRAAPDSGRAWALEGLTLARRNRWAQAQAVFDTALQRMTPAQRAPYLNLGLILKSVDDARFHDMTAAQRAQLRHLYWTVTQPLFLDSLNQPRTEFYARLTYVDHRWSDPLRGYRGYESDRGAVYVRYGPPDIWATFGREHMSQNNALNSLESERNTIMWVYKRSELRFIFSLTPGFARAVFVGDFKSFYAAARKLMPVRFDNVPAVSQMDTVLVQFAQFRGNQPDSTDLAVYGFMPIGRMAYGIGVDSVRLVTAAVLKNIRMNDVRRVRRVETIPAGDTLQIEHRSWRFELAPAQYLLRVEAELPAAERAARSSSALKLRHYGTDSLMLSDVVVANRLAPRDSSYKRWTDFLVSPSIGQIRPNQPVSLLWEIYNLVPDSTGVAHYTVTLRITVKEVERHGFAARILGGIGDAVGLSARGDNQVSLEYPASAPVAPGGTRVEYLTVNLDNAPEATYAVYLTVTDKATGRSVTARRQFRVTSKAPPR